MLTMRILCAVFYLWSLEVYSQLIPFPYVSFGVNNLSNHSYVNLTLVGNLDDGSDSVSCHTNLTTCCGSSNDGDWYFPDGNRVKPVTSGDEIYESHGAQQVALHRINNAMSPFGIYRCDIPTYVPHLEPVRRTVYVGLYPLNGGNRDHQFIIHLDCNCMCS